jgi:hypothetical protein
MVSRHYPKKAFIIAITNAKEPTATFTENHDFTVGENVSFRVTKDFGMFQINNKRAKVIDKTDDTITFDLDTSTWSAFTYDLVDTAGTTPPVCVPSSSGVIENIVTPAYNIEDAFDKRNIT